MKFSDDDRFSTYRLTATSRPDKSRYEYPSSRSINDASSIQNAATTAYPLSPEIGLYTPEVVDKVSQRFKWESMDSSMFVFELLQVAVNGWKRVFPDLFAPEFPFTTKLEGYWGTFDFF